MQILKTIVAKEAEAPNPFEERVTKDASGRARVVDALEELYAPILISLGFCYFYGFADAAQETILGVAHIYDDFFDWLLGRDESWQPSQAIWEYFLVNFAMGAVAFVPVTAWYSMRRIIRYTKLQTTPVTSWIMRLVVHLSFLFLAIGPQRALHQNEAEAQGVEIHLWMFTLYPLIFTAVYLAYNNIAFDVEERLAHRARRATFLPGFKSWLFGSGPACVVILVYAIAGLVFFAPGVAGIVGPVATVSMFFIGLTILLTNFTIWSEWMPGKFPLVVAIGTMLIASAHWFPALLFTAIWGYLFLRAVALFTAAQAQKEATTPMRRQARMLSLLTLGTGLIFVTHFFDHHCASLGGCNKVPGLEASAPVNLSSTLPDVANRQEETELEIVAAQGGGLYAAYHTALYLAARADGLIGPTVDIVDPAKGAQFRDELYAVSGVSGGSVGAGVYWAIRASGVCDKPSTNDNERPCHMQAVHDILAQDYLSPALGGFFVRDLIDTFLPISPWTNRYGLAIDRGRVLENTLNRRVNAWLKANNVPDGSHDILKRPITESTGPGLPLLFFNGTRVDTGTRLVATPVKPVISSDWLRATARPDRELSVATSMVMSARFPLVSPPLRVLDAKGETLQIVDGGYFDNSGLETAYDVVSDIRNELGHMEPKFRITALTVAEAPETDERIAPKGTIGAPVGAFVGAWRSRVTRSIERMDPIEGKVHKTLNYQFSEAEITQEEANFTLSWYLAPKTFQTIEREILKDMSKAHARTLTRPSPN